MYLTVFHTNTYCDLQKTKEEVWIGQKDVEDMQIYQLLTGSTAQQPKPLLYCSRGRS